MLPMAECSEGGGGSERLARRRADVVARPELVMYRGERVFEPDRAYDEVSTRLA